MSNCADIITLPGTESLLPEQVCVELFQMGIERRFSFSLFCIAGDALVYMGRLEGNC